MLNIWTPAADQQRRPVMFYSHGGGFVTGSGGSRGQDGANLARHFDVVVVETNHRLGLLGFLYLDEIADEAYSGSGNNGILDLDAATKGGVPADKLKRTNIPDMKDSEFWKKMIFFQNPEDVDRHVFHEPPPFHESSSSSGGR